MLKIEVKEWENYTEITCNGKIYAKCVNAQLGLEVAKDLKESLKEHGNVDATIFVKSYGASKKF